MPQPDRGRRDDRRAELRDVMTEAVAKAVVASMREDLDALREALVDHAAAIEKHNAVARRPDLRVLEGEGREVVPVVGERGRVFASREVLVAAGVMAPSLRLVR